jgi:hypothetical protein
VPTLVVCGRQDPVTPLADHEAIAARVAGARLRVIEDCGHLSTVEQPQAASQVLAEWLREPATSAGVANAALSAPTLTLNGCSLVFSARTRTPAHRHCQRRLYCEQSGVSSHSHAAVGHFAPVDMPKKMTETNRWTKPLARQALQRRRWWLVGPRALRCSKRQPGWVRNSASCARLGTVNG